MFLSLYLSFVCTNFTNPYIIARQHPEYKPTISKNASQSTVTHLLYILGHFFGGFFFFIFAYKFFYQQLDSNLLFGFAIGGIICEQIQALVPDRGRFGLLHAVFAWGMALSMSAILIAAPLITNDVPALIASVLVLASCATACLIVGKKKFWIPQLMYFSLFYLALVILVI